jgi:DNA-binding NtrC family response regulator
VSRCIVASVSETQSAIVAPAKPSRAIAALYIGLAGDAPTTSPMRVSLRGVDRVDIGRGDRRRVERANRDGCDVLELSLADTRASSRHARVSRVGGAWVLEDLGSKNGTWVARDRTERHVLVDGDTIVVGHTALVFRDRGGEDGDLEAPSVEAPGFETLSTDLARRFHEIARAARTRVPIEISGETGTGKELAARAVHALSGRAGKLVAVNCGALPASLLEAQLFGHEKGAFTGADVARGGLIRASDGGTLFLDEIAELAMSSQTALLRVLQEQEVIPVGGDRAVKVDLRVVTATHKRLDDEVDAGRFRADLRARLLGVELLLPALRDRREDLAAIAIALLGKHTRSVAFSADSIAALYAHGWPLNIRELERALAAALAVARERIELPHLPASVREWRVTALRDDDAQLKARLEAALATHGGNLAAVARELGKDRTQIRRWMKRFGLSRGADDD